MLINIYKQDCFFPFYPHTQPDKAIEIYESALKKNPKDAFLIRKVGKAYIKAHLYEKAVTYYKAAIKAHKNLDDQSIDYNAKNGTLVLKGSVKTAAQKKEAAMLAKSVPNVKEVVDELEVKPDKGSTAQ